MMSSQEGTPLRKSHWAWCVAAATLFAVALPAAGAASTGARPQAHAAAEVSLGTLNPPLNGTSVYSPTLTAGATYRVVATGTVNQPASATSVSTTSDALQCFAAPIPGVPCGPSHLVVRYEGEPGESGLDDLNPDSALPYDGVSHRYEDTFTPRGPGTIRLEAFVKPLSSGPTIQGGFTLELFGPPPPPPPAGGAPGGGSPAAPTVPQLLAAAAWGPIRGPGVALGPGGEVIAISPPIAKRQREAGITVSGDTTGQTTVTTALRFRFKGSKPPKKVPEKPGDCVLAAAAIYSTILGSRSLREYQHDHPGLITDAEIDAILEKRRGHALWETVAWLSVCLDYLKEVDYLTELERQSHMATLKPSAGAARLSCKLRANAVKVRHDRAARTIFWSTRRPSHRPVPLLRGSCQQSRNGTLTLRLGTASRRVKLRKLLGPRLLVGVYRSVAASGTANVQMGFKRR